MRQPDFVESVRLVLQASAAPAPHLKLEMAESLVIVGNTPEVFI